MVVDVPQTMCVRFLTLALACGWANPGLADSATGPAVATINAGKNCPKLFGGPSVLHQNAQRRAQRIERVEKTKIGYRVFHHKGSWAEPRTMKLKGVKVVGTRMVQDRQEALVEVRDGEQIGCASGIYALGQDQSVGQLGSIVAVEQSVVLIDAGEELGVVPVKDNLVPKIEAVWRSDYSVVPSGVASTRRAGQSGGVTLSADGDSIARGAKEKAAKSSPAKAKAVAPEIQPRSTVRPQRGPTPKIAPARGGVK